MPSSSCIKPNNDNPSTGIAWFEHEPGGHTLVIADHNGAFAPGVEPEVHFTQPGAVIENGRG